MNDIRSIDTFYNNNYFLSRLEARWAVFFDELRIKYLYEPEGFILPDGSNYLPDFWLPQFECYAEVKPDDKGYYFSFKPKHWPKHLDEGSHSYKDDLIKAHPDYKKWVQVDKPVLLLIGNPHNYCMPLLNIKESVDGICTVCFYYDHTCWRFWVEPSDEEFDHVVGAAEIANRTRFEFNK